MIVFLLRTLVDSTQYRLQVRREFEHKAYSGSIPNSNNGDDPGNDPDKTPRGSKPVKVKKEYTRSYHLYSSKDREQFFDLWIERPGCSIASIATQLGIKSRNAQRGVKEYKESNEELLPEPKPRGKAARSKLDESHKEY